MVFRDFTNDMFCLPLSAFMVNRQANSDKVLLEL